MSSSMFLLPSLRLVLLLLVLDTHRSEELAAPDRVVHHGFVCGLLLSLDGQQGVVADLGSRVAGAVGILQGHETLLPGLLFQLLVFIPLDEVVDSSLAQQVRLGFFGGARLAIGRALVHPVDAINALLSTGCLQLLLELLLGALLLDLIDALLGALALGEGLLFLVVDGCLVASQSGMEGLLQVEIAASHNGQFALRRLVWLGVEE